MEHRMPQLDVLRVFVADDGSAGNPLGVFLEGADVPLDARQAVAADLGYSETVFVDDLASGTLQIFTPGSELPFAGHPLVGTSWLLREHGCPVDALRPPAGEVPTWVEDGRTWIRGRPEWLPGAVSEQLESAAAVDAHDGAGDGYFWAWEDEGAGRVRSRFFAAQFGIPEDPATGSAAVTLAAHVARPITIRQGGGSILHARPGPDGTGEAGGLVMHDEQREYVLGGE
jgi:predicted PhzF superfamily epimerase YddE/YHI9